MRVECVLSQLVPLYYLLELLQPELLLVVKHRFQAVGSLLALNSEPKRPIHLLHLLLDVIVVAHLENVGILNSAVERLYVVSFVDIEHLRAVVQQEVPLVPALNQGPDLGILCFLQEEPLAGVLANAKSS